MKGLGSVLGEIKPLILLILILKLLNLWRLLLCRRTISGRASFAGWDWAATCWDRREGTAFDGARVEAQSHGRLVSVFPKRGGRAGWHVLAWPLGRAWRGELRMNAMRGGCDEGVVVVLEIRRRKSGGGARKIVRETVGIVVGSPMSWQGATITGKMISLSGELAGAVWCVLGCIRWEGA